MERINLNIRPVISCEILLIKFNQCCEFKCTFNSVNEGNKANLIMIRLVGIGLAPSEQQSRRCVNARRMPLWVLDSMGSMLRK